MRIDIIIAYIQRYRRGHEVDFVPPLTGIHLAALTPPEHEVRVIHQQVEKVDMQTDASLIAISFFSGFAPEAYRLARAFRKAGKTVVAGGPHVTYNQEEALACFDAIVAGEAETAWRQLLNDFEQGSLQPVYTGSPSDMQGLPTPRYELLKNKFFVPRVIQATRGCPFRCSFCTVPSLNPGFRLRPVEDVIRDIRYNDFPFWWQRKIVWFWDDNLTINRPYIKELLAAMAPLKKWWLTQASIDITKDEELLGLMQASGCIGIFLGIESFSPESLRDANKRQNKIAHYRQAIGALHKRGIAVMAGFIAGFGHDTPASIIDMARLILEAGVDVPFLSILTPFKGTPLYDSLSGENRLDENRGWEYYNGYNVAFHPKNMSQEELLRSHRMLWKKAFSPAHVARRVLTGLFRLRFGAFCLSLFMNTFYCYKRLTGNLPIEAGSLTEYQTAGEVADTACARPATVEFLGKINTR
ncbi:MAG: B12-binding domain-containing radical SAM protein [Lewinellaceae bacterium]|nr:B12-binding domain-containing radical SAM protein [Lewinellaceae bacterium]